MKSIKNLIIIAGIIIFIASFFIIKNKAKQNHTQNSIIVAILQTASHPALDAARQGFTDQLEQKLGKKVNFVTQIAQGSINNAHTIAQQFHANKNIHAIFAIATPAAQAIASIEKEKPIFIAAVTDPKSLGFAHDKTNVCGTTDMINAKAEIEMLAQLLPQAKTVALIFNNAERNSVFLVNQFKDELSARGLNVIEMGITQEADMPIAVETACRKADVLLAPTDNMVASAIKLIALITEKHKKPLIVSDNLLVQHGALAARGVDYKESGKQAANSALQVLLKNKKPCEIGFAMPKTEKIVVNKKVMESLGLSMPDSLNKDVAVVE